MNMERTGSTELWHRQMGHIDPQSLDILNIAKEDGVEVGDSVFLCTTPAVEKSKKLAHLKKIIHDVSVLLQLFYVDLLSKYYPPH